MKAKKKANQNKEKNFSTVSETFNEPQALTETEKRALHVKDGQNNHHVDERGGN